ncbi:Uncharacterised protein [uncultured archaeon]|nr:Uncharacterised protein [uncultured archaeon]
MDENDKKELLLYKNLEFISNAYYSAEGIFPFWESAFALIVGQIIIAHFAASNFGERAFLSFIGFIFSILWFKLVCVTRQHAKFLDNTMKNLESKLDDEYQKSKSKFFGESKKEKIDEFKNDEIIENFNFNFSMLFEMRPKWEAWDSNWYIRRLLPFLLAIILLILVIVDLYFLLHDY